MSTNSQRGGRRGLFLAAATTVVLAVLGITFLIAGRHHAGPPQPSSVGAASALASRAPTAGAPPSPTPTARPSAELARDPDLGPIMPASEPVSLDIASIDVHADKLVDLGYTKDGALEVPLDFDLPGWFSPGPSPGQFGPAVIAGHVDSKSGPAVFYKLGALRPGAKVRVGRKDGTTATFTVDKVERYAKSAFPTSEVYGNTTNRAELRLITCGGSFDRSTGHYVDNVVAYAHLIA